MWEDRLVDRPDDSTVAVQEVVCPRCAQRGEQRFYGPCDTCRAELRTTQAGARRDVEVAAYEPKVNVTPNAVATKE
jgi:hypothetical protein